MIIIKLTAMTMNWMLLPVPLLRLFILLSRCPYFEYLYEHGVALMLNICTNMALPLC